MTQAVALVGSLKKALKSHGLTYRAVAGALGLSEASVKRLFATGNFSLERLEQVCELVGLTFADLVREMEAGARLISVLSLEQEREVVSEPKLLLVAFLVVHGWRYEEIFAHYRLTEAELVSRLTRLDKLRLIELLPGNRIKLLISPDFAWHKNGPIQQFFTANVQTDFLQSHFDRPGEKLLFLSGMLSRASNTALIGKMEKLVHEFGDLKRDDQALPLERKWGCSLILAVRPWVPAVFDQLRR